MKMMEATQALGRALMLPIAVLPIAGLLLRLGQPDLLAMAPIAAAGDAIFGNLGLLFAIGVAVGLARENHGAAGLAGVVCFLVATKGAEVIIAAPPLLALAHVAAWKAKELSKLSVPIGILSGIFAGLLYNRYSDIRLPSYLSFFGGRRFVPIVAGLAGLLLAFAFGYGWPFLTRGMDVVTQGVVEAGGLGLFAYGVLNRILIVTGLHHILNNVAWFILGDFGGATGDLKRFFAGDPNAGAFMSGFFPVMMFGLPAACLAMYHTALPEKKKLAGGLLLSIGLTSFLTGVTEPIEFTFMFLAPALYVVHAVLTGAAMVTMDVLGAKLGFSFSAGLFDYILNFKLATKPWLLLPVGAAYFALYYGLFRFFIVKFNLKTPGREVDEVAIASATSSGDETDRYIAALGGAPNLTEVEACTTRLRLKVADRTQIDERVLKQLGASGVVNIGTHGVQVVIGPIADQVASEIRARLAGRGRATTGGSALPNAAELLAAIGGKGNIARIESTSGRVLVTVKDGAGVNEHSLSLLPLRGFARATAESIHLLHADPGGLERSLKSPP
ncbi:N-acetylglucosamine-specific PTS transporter subunit IIBC [Usitatibacter palustris]|uniref:PTS system N-acetylglucosamine-specific EIICBA component n=1 Tax=Usitatibacter palustris TaxID=2732487 RepID=A0A6M4HBX0_9PROT|nr:N-acetylglucosamine-specific PTS transporter subunit IIBC [Usitatibacter palustris]QJR16742.1 PTS system N-acetylglucosamine-specific EIICBA component [Usitatibacter palustris]